MFSLDVKFLFEALTMSNNEQSFSFENCRDNETGLFPRLIWNTLGYLLNAIDMVRLKTRLNIVSKMSVNPMYLLSKLAIEMDSIASMWLQPFAHHFP